MPISPLVISPGQGILLALKTLQDDAEKQKELKLCYLRGVQDTTELRKLWKTLESGTLSSYQISYSDSAINNDPTRRYFETHLAFHTLKNNLHELDLTELEANLEAMKTLVYADLKDCVAFTLEGNFNIFNDRFKIEYASYIKKLNQGELFHAFSEVEREKIALLMKLSYLSVLITRTGTELPIDIYGRGVFSDEHRGRITKEDQETTRSQHLGLIRSHHPLSSEDIAYASSATIMMPASLGSTYDVKAEWVQQSFAKFLPFSNSISGTILCSLRVQAKLRRTKQNTAIINSTQKIAHFYQLTIAAILAYHGGHTLDEFTAPLTLPEVLKEYKALSKFPKKMTLKSLFFSTNKIAFDTALAETQEYNLNILQKRALCEELRSNSKLLKRASTQSLLGPTLADSLTTLIKKKMDALQSSQGFFSTIKGDAKGLKLIQTRLDVIIESIQQQHLIQAQISVRRLIKEIEVTHGSRGFFGNQTKPYTMLKEIEANIREFARKNSWFSKIGSRIAGMHA